MRIPSGSTDRKIAFVALDPTDFKGRVTGLSSFTVYRSRNGGTATAYTTPTVAELSAANMPGVYVLTIDEDTTVDSGHDVEEYVVHVTATGMAPVTRALELERVKFTEGQSATVANSAVDADVERVKGTVISDLISGRLDVSVGAMQNDVVTAAAIANNAIDAGAIAADAITNSKIADDAISASKIAADAITAAKIANGAIDAATFAAGAIDAAAIATDAIDADALKADAVTEIQAGLATSFALSSVQADTDDIQSKIGTPAGASLSADVAAVKAETSSIQSDTNDIQARLPAALVGGRIDASVGAMAANTLNASALATDAVDEIADGVWDEPLAGHLTAGTTGKALSDASSGGSAPSAAAIADAVWDEDLAGHTTAGTGGANVGLRLDAAVSTRATPAQVNAEVLDVLTVDTFAEPAQGAPPATATILDRLRFLYKWLRNKVTQTSSEFKVFADDGTTVDHKAAVTDDGTTFTRGEIGSGP